MNLVYLKKIISPTVISFRIAAMIYIFVILCLSSAHSAEPISNSYNATVGFDPIAGVSSFVAQIKDVLSKTSNYLLSFFGLRRSDFDINLIKEELDQYYRMAGKFVTDIFAETDDLAKRLQARLFGNISVNVFENLYLASANYTNKRWTEFRDAYNTTFANYKQQFTTISDVLQKTLKSGTTSGLKLFTDECELYVIQDYPDRFVEDLTSNDARSVRQQILHRDPDQYTDYLKTAFPLYFTSVLYEGLCKKLKNDIVSGHAATAVDKISAIVKPSKPTVDITALSKGYFKRAVGDAKQVITEEGGINEYSCKAIIRRLRDNHFYANWTVGVYCNGCRDTRLVPEYYKTSDNVVLDKEYVFKGVGDKENYYQVWANGNEFVFLASAVGGKPSQEGWASKMQTCLNTVATASLSSSLFEKESDKRSKALKECVEKSKINFSIMGMLETKTWGCIEYDENQAVARWFNQFYLFAVDKKQA